MLHLYTEFLQGIACSVYFFKDLLVSERLILVIDRRPLTASRGDVLVHECGSGVVNVGQLDFHAGIYSPPMNSDWVSVAITTDFESV